MAAIAAGIGRKSGRRIVALVSLRIGGIAGRDIGASEALARAPFAVLMAPSPCASAAGPVAVFELILPWESAPNPVATFELESVPVLVSLALALVPTAVFAPTEVPLLALALVPQATLLVPLAAVAPAPSCGSLPSTLPPQTNCACACDAPRLHASAIASADVEEIKDKRMHFITGPTPEKYFAKVLARLRPP
jgi:hypothetical protein